MMLPKCNIRNFSLTIVTCTYQVSENFQNMKLTVYEISAHFPDSTQVQPPS